MASIEEIKERLRNKDQLEAELAKQQRRPSAFTMAVIFLLVGGAGYNYLSRPSSRSTNSAKIEAISSIADSSIPPAASASVPSTGTAAATPVNIQAVMPELQELKVSAAVDKIPTEARDPEESGLLVSPEGAKNGETQYLLVVRLPAAYRAEASQFPDLAK